jgi:hydroxypyruvate isomerase
MITITEPDAMPRYSANLGFLFADRPHVERIRAAAQAGFRAVEMHWPYDVPAEEIRSALRECGVTMLGVNTPVGDAAAGDFGLAAVRGREQEFQTAVDSSLAYAQAIGATALHCMAGVVTENPSAAQAVFVDNIRRAADKALALGVTILIEPINWRDKPNYFLHRIDQAADLVAKTERSNVRIMFDCYHTQITEGDLSHKLVSYLPLIGHVQIAAVPSRAEPDEGEIHYPALMDLLDAKGYEGWVGAEYKPRGRTEDGLGWLKRWSGARKG